MAKASRDYRKAYSTAKKELTKLLADQKHIETRVIVVRQSIQTLATLCEEHGMKVDPSDEAVAILENSSLADEIRSLLQVHYPTWMRPNWIKAEIERLGHDLSKYSNAQASVQMVLKRMVDSKDVEEQVNHEGKKEYRKSPATYVSVRKLHPHTASSEVEIED